MRHEETTRLRETETGRRRAEDAARVRERGFTLIETSIALIVMMVAALAAGSLFVYAVNYNTGATDRELSMNVAQQQIERLRNIPFDATTRNLAVASGGLGATCTSSATCTDGVTSTVNSGGRPYTVLTTINDVQISGGVPVLKRITVRVTPGSTSVSALGSVTVTTMRATVIKGTN